MIRVNSPQHDSFVRDRLPKPGNMPEFPGVDPDPGVLNCVTFLLDAHLDGPSADRLAIRSGARSWTYRQLGHHVGQMANVLTQNYGVRPGNRVLLRGANSPEIAALWLAVQKIGAVGVVSMSLLRAGELVTLIDHAKPVLAVCDVDISADLETALGLAGLECQMVTFTDEGGQLFDEMSLKSPDCETCQTLADDASVIGYTSGTTGAPKATVHFHRDILAICETVCRHIIRPTADDVFIGTAPLAFTFGLGGLLIFPFYAGACTVLNPRYSAQGFAAAIAHYRASICFTVPTFYQRMLRAENALSFNTLRLAVSSGEALPQGVRDLWQDQTGVNLAEVLGSTEMLHAFAGAQGAAIRPGLIGPAIPGYELAILDPMGQALPLGTVGRLAVKGPTGCRYLTDPRQSEYVQNGWNLTGDMCKMDTSGYIAYLSRADDMIISAGYNISGLEVENALLTHPGVAECAVIGVADEQRGQIVVAFVVPVQVENPATPDQLQAHVQRLIAPYKYPRRIEFVDALPRNESGKLQRFRLS
ncbi:MAG: AMP-binding protein [Rhodobacteraceae bacterium]|nr:AMP-binding protein [Paracoccaceae bacterium]